MNHFIIKFSYYAQSLKITGLDHLEVWLGEDFNRCGIHLVAVSEALLEPMDVT